MSLSHLSRKMDTKQLTLKTSLGKSLNFKGEERILGSQAKHLSPLEEEKLAGIGAVSTNVQLL